MSGGIRSRLADLSRARYEEVWELVRTSLALEGPSRESALADAGARDPELAELARQVLAGPQGAASGTAARILGRAASDLADEAPPAARAVAALPRQFGRYVLLRELGHGGMGTVYEAEQESPRRRVALKVLRADFASPEHERRFRHEARLLGQLRHPGIAQVFEGGLAPVGDGREVPYIAMELIEGLSLLDHARELRLGVPARLELLARVCDAVQHAHARRIVHRDLKPANVLVDGEGQPKVLDFGVARTMDAALSPTTLLTRSGHVVGTIAYMSPEQASGHGSEADARSDVYSLGVIAYELLCGRRPHDTGSLDWPRALHAICTEEPPALGTVDSRLRGDVETIVGKALEKSPERRYQSAAELADDLRRHLCSEPILARAPSVSYRVRRFVQRHRALVGALGGLFVVLLAGSVISARLALKERAARRDAVAAAEIATRHEAEARREHGLASLALAGAALDDGDAGVARRHLDRVDASDRGWAWRHLAGRLDGSQAVVATGHPGVDQAAGFVDGGRLLALVTWEAASLIDLRERRLLWTRPLPEARLLHMVPVEGGVLLEDDAGRFVLDLPTWTRRELDAEDAPARTLARQLADGAAVQAVVPRLRNGQIEIDFLDLVQARTVAVARGIPGEIAQGDDATTRRPPIPLLDREHRLLVTSSELPGVAGVTWDVMTGRRMRRLQGPPGRIDIFSVSPDGSEIVGGGADGLLLKWDAATGRPMPWEPPGLKGHVDGLRHSHDGLTIVVDQIGGRPFALDAVSGRMRWRMGDGNRAWASVPELGPGGVLLVPVSRGAVKLIDVADGSELARLIGHREQVRLHVFSPDGSTVITGDHGGEIRFWDPLRARRRWRHDSYVYGVGFDPAGRRVASGGWDGTVRIWDVQTGAALARLQPPAPKGNDGVVAWSPDGRWLASGHDCQVAIFDASSFALRGSVPLGTAPRRCAITGLRWEPSGRRLLVARESGALTMLDVGPGGDGITVSEWPVASSAVALSPRGGRLVAAIEGSGETWSIEEWEIDPPRRRRELATALGRITALAISGDGSTIAAAGHDGSLRLFDAASGRPGAILDGHVGPAWCVAFHPDGSLLASGGDDDVIRLWDLPAGREVLELGGHGDYVYALDWSPDGSILVSGSGDGSVRTWRAPPPG